MAPHAFGDDKTYDSPSDFFEAMDYAGTGPEVLKFNQPVFNNPFKANSSLNQAIDPMLSSNQLDSFNLGTNFWTDPTQFGVLETINPTLSPLDGNQSCDTGYVSQEAGSDKSPPLGATSSVSSKQNSTAPKPRKRSSTKNATINAANIETKPPRKARRTSTPKTSVVKVNMEEEEDDEKREQFLARNREAASKCRQKKKEWTQDLEQRARELSSQKQMLTTYLAMLKNELLMLKCKCLEHSDCGCDGIRDYLKTTVNTMTPANAALYSKLEDKNIEDIENEIARKQSSAASVFGDLHSPEQMVASPSSTGGDISVDMLRFEADLQAAIKD